MPTDPIPSTIMPLVPVSSHPGLVRITYDPISLLPCKRIISPNPFSLNPDMLRGRRRRSFKNRLWRNCAYKYIIRDPFPISSYPIPFPIVPLRPMSLYKYLIRVRDRPIAGLVYISVILPDPFSVNPQMSRGRLGRPEQIRFRDPAAYSDMRNGFPYPGLPIGASIRISYPFSFYPDMISLGNRPITRLRFIMIASPNPFPFDPYMSI
jgi:hypothetical protein